MGPTSRHHAYVAWWMGYAIHSRGRTYGCPGRRGRPARPVPQRINSMKLVLHLTFFNRGTGKDPVGVLLESSAGFSLRCFPQCFPCFPAVRGTGTKTGGTREHPRGTFWADESLVLVFHHVVLSKPTGHESSSFRKLFHVVGVLCPFPACLLPVCATLWGVTFGNQSVLGCLRVRMGTRPVRLRDAFGLCLFHGKCDMLPRFLLRCCMWLWGVWLGRSVPKRVFEAGRSALFEVRLVFGPHNCAQAVLDYISDTT